MCSKTTRETYHINFPKDQAFAGVVDSSKTRAATCIDRLARAMNVQKVGDSIGQDRTGGARCAVLWLIVAVSEYYLLVVCHLSDDLAGNRKVNVYRTFDK